MDSTTDCFLGNWQTAKHLDLNDNRAGLFSRLVFAEWGAWRTSYIWITFRCLLGICLNRVPNYSGWNIRYQVDSSNKSYHLKYFFMNTRLRIYLFTSERPKQMFSKFDSRFCVDTKTEIVTVAMKKKKSVDIQNWELEKKLTILNKCKSLMSIMNASLVFHIRKEMENLK